MGLKRECDQCGKQAHASSAEDIPVSWMILRPYSGTGYGDRTKWLCSPQCLLAEAEDRRDYALKFPELV
jgi:hypothetical protein